MGFKGFVEGGMAAVVAGCTTHPLDLIKVRLQLHGEAATTISRPGKRPGLISEGIKVARNEGLPALFSGVSASALRQALYSTTRMGLYEVLKESWSDPSTGFPMFKKVAAGLIAGAVGAAVGNPADVAMVRMQADGRLPIHERRNYSSVGDALVKMVRREGIGSLWRGSTPTIQRAMVVTASQLASYDQIKESLISTNNSVVKMEDGVATHFTASCLAGLVAAVASNPIDVVKTRIMNMKVEEAGKPGTRLYSGSLDCVMKTVRAEGVMALYKGFIPTVTRQGPFTIVMFMTLEQIRRLLKDF